MITTLVVGALLGAAAAQSAVYLAVFTKNGQPEHPRRLRAVLTVLAIAFSAIAAQRHGLASTASALLALVPAGAAAAVDAWERRLPDALTAALATAMALHIAALIVVGDEAGERAAWTFVVGSTLCVLAKGLFTEAIGWGDVKLAPSLAALLAVHGWSALYTGLLAWSGLILLVALLDLAGANPTRVVAYGPAMVTGTACAIAS
jgi:leader peptidase (prepilin peptidase)/N-methyltransferase